jgi:hypothetical protein
VKPEEKITKVIDGETPQVQLNIGGVATFVFIVAENADNPGNYHIVQYI